jgi:hypothetical protein
MSKRSHRPRGHGLTRTIRQGDIRPDALTTRPAAADPPRDARTLRALSRNKATGLGRDRDSRNKVDCGPAFAARSATPAKSQSEMPYFFIMELMTCMRSPKKEPKSLAVPFVIAGLSRLSRSEGHKCFPTGYEPSGPFFQNELRRFSQAESVGACAVAIWRNDPNRRARHLGETKPPRPPAPQIFPTVLSRARG